MREGLGFCMKSVRREGVSCAYAILHFYTCVGEKDYSFVLNHSMEVTADNIYDCLIATEALLTLTFFNNDKK